MTIMEWGIREIYNDAQCGLKPQVHDSVSIIHTPYSCSFSKGLLLLVRIEQTICHYSLSSLSPQSVCQLNVLA
ncbi:MAG: hypothetical protein WAM42_01545, partial [Candidatus Nitrosopolaris sp.]